MFEAVRFYRRQPRYCSLLLAVRFFARQPRYCSRLLAVIRPTFLKMSVSIIDNSDCSLIFVIRPENLSVPIPPFVSLRGRRYQRSCWDVSHYSRVDSDP